MKPSVSNRLRLGNLRNRLRRPAAPTDLHRRLCLRAGMAALAGSALTGCWQAQPLVVGLHSWIGYEPLFLAQSLAFLQNAAIRLLPTDSATESLQLLHAGEIQAAALTLDEVLRARADGLDLTVVLVFNVSMGADAVVARPGIGHPEAISGLRIGVEESALGALMLDRLLAAGNLSRDAVTVVPLTFEQHGAAWHSAAIDVLITFEPLLSGLRSGGAEVILDSRQFPDTIFGVLAVRERSLGAAQRAALRDLLSGHFQALQHLQRQREDATYRIAARMNVDAVHVRQALRGIELPHLGANHDYLRGQDQRLMNAVRELSLIMVQANLMRTPDSGGGLFTHAYLPHLQHL